MHGERPLRGSIRIDTEDLAYDTPVEFSPRQRATEPEPPRARALGRTDESLKSALAELERRRVNLACLRTRGAGEPDLRAAVDAFHEQRRMAEKRRLDLVIHREAAGFRKNQAVYERYPIPPPER